MDERTLEGLARTLQFVRELVLMKDAASDERIARALLRTSVAIVADESNVSSAAAQSAIVALARLVLGFGASLRLIFPEVELAGPQPPLHGNSLRWGIADLAQDLIPGTRAMTADRTARADIIFIVGDTPWRGDARAAWRLVADAWSGGIVPAGDRGARIASASPIGALIAATVAAAEPFKATMASIGVALRSSEALAPVGTARVRLGPENIELGDIDLEAFDCISGGAIVNAALFALLRVPGLSGRARILEPERGALSNLNRYSLMRRSRVHLPKVAMLREWSRADFDLAGEETIVNAETLASLQPLAARVLVGTDAVPPRWLIQREWPTQLVVGSTADWTAIVSEHPRGAPCIGCVNFEDEPARGDIATVSFVSFWAGLVAASRLLRDAAHRPHPNSEQLTEVLGPLRLDSTAGLRTRAVLRHPRCPLDCHPLTLAAPAARLQ
jgi:hypothetical protein